MSTTDNQLLVEIEKTKQAEISSRTDKTITRTVSMSIVLVILGCGFLISTCKTEKNNGKQRQTFVELRAEYDHTVEKLQACKTELRALDRVVKESYTSPTP